MKGTSTLEGEEISEAALRAASEWSNNQLLQKLPLLAGRRFLVC
jgi:hypothetical protein